MKEKYILTQSTWFLVANYVPLSEIFSKKILKFNWKILPPNSHFGTLDSRCFVSLFLMWTPFEEVIVRVFQSYLFIETGDQKVVIKNSFWWIGYFALATSDWSAQKLRKIAQLWKCDQCWYVFSQNPFHKVERHASGSFLLVSIDGAASDQI